MFWPIDLTPSKRIINRLVLDEFFFSKKNDTNQFVQIWLGWIVDPNNMINPNFFNICLC